ncbi:MAG: sigma-70 family RNA polymerase sigma factor, partial [Planctomycetes bacterium]|nr:sigma-70 family RNA polymerase sigma factor [Planctomycetota bacterium]
AWRRRKVAALTSESGGGTPLFPTTQWTELSNLSRATEAEQQEILTRFFDRYERPFRVLLRKRGAGDHVDDVLQGFVADKILSRDLLQSVDRAKGRLRSFLATSLQHYWYDYLRRLKRNRVECGPEAADTAGAESEATDSFDIEWAHQLLTDTLTRMQEECRAKNRPDLWGVFHGRISGPLIDGSPRVSYDELVTCYSLPSPTHAANLLITGRRMFMRQLRESISEYDGEHVEQEIEELRSTLLRVAETRAWGPAHRESVSAEENP